MDIRLAQTKDISGLIHLLRQVGPVHHELRPDIFVPGTLKYDEAALAELLKDEARPVFVATEDEQLLGYCFCIHRDHQKSSSGTCRKELYIDDLCIEEQYRGHGVAEALYRHAEQYAKDWGCNFVTLNVWCGNDRAMGFYRKMGLRPRHIMMEQPLEDVDAD